MKPITIIQELQPSKQFFNIASLVMSHYYLDYPNYQIMGHATQFNYQFLAKMLLKPFAGLWKYQINYTIICQLPIITVLAKLSGY